MAGGGAEVRRLAGGAGQWCVPCHAVSCSVMQCRAREPAWGAQAVPRANGEQEPQWKTRNNREQLVQRARWRRLAPAAAGGGARVQLTPRKSRGSAGDGVTETGGAGVSLGGRRGLAALAGSGTKRSLCWSQG